MLFYARTLTSSKMRSVALAPHLKNTKFESLSQSFSSWGLKGIFQWYLSFDVLKYGWCKSGSFMVLKIIEHFLYFSNKNSYRNIKNLTNIWKRTIVAQRQAVRIKIGLNLFEQKLLEAPFRHFIQCLENKSQWKGAAEYLPSYIVLFVFLSMPEIGSMKKSFCRVVKNVSLKILLSFFALSLVQIFRLTSI
jgi:hypothetical protein